MNSRRDFITLLGGAAVAWPLAARAQQPAMPVVGFLSPLELGSGGHLLDAFRRGLAETGNVEGQNVAIEYRLAGDRLDRFPELAADLVRRQVSAIAASGSGAAVAAKAATQTLPIAFSVPEDPVKLGLVASLARPGSNATGINFFTAEVNAKRLGLLRELVPAAVRVAMLMNPSNTINTSSTLAEVGPAARGMGLQIQIFNASTSREIDAAFATIERERPDALFVTGDAFFVSRAVQLATLTARGRIPATYSLRDYVAVGGLMSYGTDFTEAFRQVGVYTSKILRGAKPTDLPVMQSTKFEFVINLQTARSLGIEVPPGVLSIADEVIE
jgi:putative tryptophan/tyrosine transport system substrate-binding protein